MMKGDTQLTSSNLESNTILHFHVKNVMILDDTCSYAVAPLCLISNQVIILAISLFPPQAEPFNLSGNPIMI